MRRSVREVAALRFPGPVSTPKTIGRTDPSDPRTRRLIARIVRFRFFRTLRSKHSASYPPLELSIYAGLHNQKTRCANAILGYCATGFLTRLRNTSLQRAVKGVT